jgi:hypothetical protein
MPPFQGIRNLQDILYISTMKMSTLLFFRGIRLRTNSRSVISLFRGIRLLTHVASYPFFEESDYALMQRHIPFSRDRTTHSCNVMSQTTESSTSPLREPRNFHLCCWCARRTESNTRWCRGSSLVLHAFPVLATPVTLRVEWNCVVQSLQNRGYSHSIRFDLDSIKPMYQQLIWLEQLKI